MKSYALKTLFLLLILSSCGKHNFLEENLTQKTIGSLRAPYKISIDSSYAYHGDSLYRVMAREYYSDSSKSASIKTQRKTHKSNVAAAIQKQNMTPEDEAFFSKRHTVTSTEATIYHGRNYIYPGAIIEGSTISKADYLPVYVQDRNPITLSGRECLIIAV